MGLPSAFNVGSFRWGYEQNGGVPVETVQAMARSADGSALPLESKRDVKWSEWVSISWKINRILILGVADQDGPCVNVLPTHWEENFHLCSCHLCWGNWLRERFWQVRYKLILPWWNLKPFVSCRFNDLWFFQLCRLPLGDSQQGQTVEGHQSEVWKQWRRGGVNAKITLNRTIVS